MINITSSSNKILIDFNGAHTDRLSGPFKYGFVNDVLLLSIGNESMKIPFDQLQVGGVTPASQAAALTALDTVFLNPVATGIPSQYVKAVFASSLAYTNTLAAGATSYLCITGSGLFAVEAGRKMVIPTGGDGYLRNFRVLTGDVQSAGGALVLTTRKAGVDSSLVVTIAAGSAAGTFSDNTNELQVAAGDVISIKGVNNGSGNSAPVVSVAMTLYSR